MRLTDNQPSSGHLSNDGHHASSATTLLIAEDDSAVLDFMKSVFEQAGYQVLVAENGTRALELCRTNRGSVDVLVTDVVMPETNGRELGERARLLLPDLKILYISGYVDRGADDYDSAFLEKPFDAEALLTAIHQLCAVRQSH